MPGLPAPDAPRADAARALAAVWRIESPRVIARLVRMTGDLTIAEELAQDVMVAALEAWPREGVPASPGAWLMTSARNRAIDWLRRHALQARWHAGGVDVDTIAAPGSDPGERAGNPFDDDLLRLVFIACHPVLPRESRVALTLRLLGGLGTAEIARAFLQPESTVAQRIVRAKRTLGEAGVPFEAPARSDWPARLDAVLEVLYLVFNEGYSASSGDDPVRPALCDEALRLGRVLLHLMPDEPEVAGLLALMELQASRLRARVDARGATVLLEDQDRGRWDWLQVERGLAALAHAEALGKGDGPYALQAAIAACHARARRAEDTDWPRIAALYARLEHIAPNPVVSLNRVVAVCRAEGPSAALALLAPLRTHPRLQGYAALHAVEGDVRARLGERDAARAAFLRAAGLSGNARDREALEARAAALGA